MDARYGDEVSNLKISRIAGEFLVKHARNFGKRLFYNYYLRDLSVASIELPLGHARAGAATLYRCRLRQKKFKRNFAELRVQNAI